MMRRLGIYLLILALVFASMPALAEFEIIEKGAKGDRVVEIQNYLIEEGFLTGEADGDFGKGTEAAVIAFQEANGIEATGIVDENTYDLLTGNIPPEELVEIDLDRVDRNTLEAGDSHFVAILEDGHVIAVNDGEVEYEFGQCDVSDWEDIISVGAGMNFTVGLKSNGTVVGAGNTNFYQGIRNWTGIIDIACGKFHTVGLTMDGTVVAAGSNDEGQQNNLSNWTDIVDVACGTFHTIGLRADGTVLAVGHNDYGQCNVSGWTDIVAIAGNMWATFGLKSDGTVVYTGGHDARDRAKLDAVKRWDDIVSIKAYGNTDVFGIKADGTIVDINERLVDINERIKSDTVGLDVAFSSWHDTVIYALPDGSVESNKTDIEAAFSGNKIQAPSQYELATDGNDETAQDTGIWTVRAYIDEFNLPTDEYYITNETAFIGTFSNSATTNSTLAAYLYCEQYNGNDMLRIRLLEYGSSRVNNPYSSTRYYDITVMDADGVRYYTEGSMYSGSYDVYVLDEQLVLDALKKGGTVRLAITERDDPLTNYIITIDDANGFSAAYYEFWNR